MATDKEVIEQLTTRTRRPSTPGDAVAQLIEEKGIKQGELAVRLGVGRQSVNALLCGRRSLTPDMAHRLGKFFGNGPALWLNMQRKVDLWDTLHMDTSQYERIRPLPRDVARAAPAHTPDRAARAPRARAGRPGHNAFGRRAKVLA